MQGQRPHGGASGKPRPQAQPAVVAAQLRMFQIGETAFSRGAAACLAAAILGEDLLRQNLSDGAGILASSTSGSHCGSGLAGYRRAVAGYAERSPHAQSAAPPDSGFCFCPGWSASRAICKSWKSAEQAIAEVGPGAAAFASVPELCSWAGVLSRPGGVQITPSPSPRRYTPNGVPRVGFRPCATPPEPAPLASHARRAIFVL